MEIVTYSVDFRVHADPEKDYEQYEAELRRIEEDLGTIGAVRIQNEDEGS